MITGILSQSNTSGAILITNVKVNGMAIKRSHINIRQHDINSNASIDITHNHVCIKGDISEYNHNGIIKACIINITSIKSVK